MQRPMPDQGPEVPDDPEPEEEQGDQTPQPTPAQPIPIPAERPVGAARGSERRGLGSRNSLYRSVHPGTHRDPF
jgi:hypothetical protein